MERKLSIERKKLIKRSIDGAIENSLESQNRKKEGWIDGDRLFKVELRLIICRKKQGAKNL